MRIRRSTPALGRTTILLGAAAAIAALLLVPAIPSVRRYVRMKRM